MRHSSAPCSLILLCTLLLAAGSVDAADATPTLPTAAETMVPPDLALIPVDAAQVLEEVRRPGAAGTLVNVWATWCVPCREEFPDLIKVYRELQPRGLRLVLVSADFDDDREATVKKYLRAHGVDFTTYLKEQQDQEFIEGLTSEWSGALPVSLFYDANGVLRDVLEGAGTYKSLKKKAKSVLGSKTRPKEAQ
jgi:thiol-disulfide isomerase/thioredoxin